MRQHIGLPFVLFLLVTGFCHGQITIADIALDTTITGFKKANSFEFMAIYLPNGERDLSETGNISTYAIMVEHDMTYDSAVLFLNMLLAFSTQQGYHHADRVSQDTILNGLRAHEVTVTETQPDSDYQNLLYYAFILKGNTAIVFVSGDLAKGVFRDKFRQTFYSLRV